MMRLGDIYRGITGTVRDPFSAETTGLPDAASTEIVELRDGARFQLTAGPVRKRARMAALTAFSSRGSSSGAATSRPAVSPGFPTRPSSPYPTMLAPRMERDCGHDYVICRGWSVICLTGAASRTVPLSRLKSRLPADVPEPHRG